ncbi:alpha/beta hydrolase fold protein [Ancylobacter novellus DSM 506]|uniref:Alpha/beta hydrolase fold protein n=1 Tax=Ancylobacter novellus (strain ATCC 8093 / DSM 506 / JCM 20403 / CCM 1077 / IAM 12100 / NBRC 12443 / NCIMB 10456) TaxID=639283 RepID=D7A3C8_ANCN5|nr:alpha/beta hydrolase [Ancylobacter novellus]ADH89687.1 alpha/beta hydrolase fold protein [Ancylobacter novellus DSM 506]
MASFVSQFVAAPAGAVECFVAHGQADPANGSFVLVHGIQGTAAAWAGIAPRLDSGRAVLMPNLRGRGRSPSPDDTAAYTLGHFADDLAAVIASAPGPVTLVGWSMGVLVTLTYIARFGSAKLDGLLLASGTAHPGNEAVWFHAETTEGVAQEARARAARLGLTAYATSTAVAGAWASVRAADLRPVLTQIELPTRVLHCELDDQCPLDHGRLIAASIPNASLEVWPGAGHNLMAEDPARFAQSVLRLYAAARSDRLKTTQ